jgi:hypothetical protein
MGKVEIERFSLISSKPFEVVMETLKAAIGQPDLFELFRAFDRARSFTELENAVQKGLGRTGLMLFMEFDLGAILRQETGLAKNRALSHRQSAHHERNGEACSRSRILRSGHRSAG